MMPFRVGLLSILFVYTLAGCLSADTAEKAEFFESRIRPVLIEHCYECHNSTENADGELAVDYKQAMLAGGDGGKIITPGNAKASRLIAILRHEVDGLEMPENGPKLSDQVVADFEKWINDGAFDPRSEPPSEDEIANATSWESIRERRKQWWSFQPIKNASPPAEGHIVDAFVNERIKNAGLKAAPQAEPAALVRRLYFTLIGLPPTVEQASTWADRISAAKDNQRADIIEQLIDELIESPRFGERWARHWMDWIRYAESHGSEGDPRINNAWMYRDYLIRALNTDVPYDQLVREHIAGDLLESPRINHDLGINESMLGPVHWRMVFHGFAPTDALDERVRYTDDQINAFSKAFLGITVSCARCHDHKFDAISQKDYYALFGVLASCRPARTVVDVEEKQLRNKQELADLKPQIRSAIAKDWSNQLEKIGERVRSLQPKDGKDKGPKSLLSGLVYQFNKNPDSLKIRQQQFKSRVTKAPSISFQWNLNEQDDLNEWFSKGIGLSDRVSDAGEFAIAAKGNAALTGIYPSGVYSHLLSAKHAGRLTSPDFKLGEKQEIWIQAIGENQSRVRYVVQDYPRNGTVYPINDLDSKWHWRRYDATYWNGDDLHLELATSQDAPLIVRNQTRSWFGVRRAIVQSIGQPSPERKEESIALLLSSTESPTNQSEFIAWYQSIVAKAIHAWESGSAIDEQALLLDECIRDGFLTNELVKLPTAKPLLQKYRELENAIPTPTRVPGLDETLARDWPLYLRGNHKTPSDTVPRRFLEAIDPTPFQTQQSGRRELAEKLLDPANPLTRRVIVNRIWHHLLGKGIVSSPDNFGRLGQKPTHPELLDHLAVQFASDGWSIKKLIRLIVTSKTWQRSSSGDDKASEIDPNNELLTHANVRRLEAEAIRDALFATSGQLEHQLYGPPVSGNVARRSVYINVIRNSLDPFLRAFDFPEPFSTTGRRDVTNVPAQSLTMMNDPIVDNHAVNWSGRVLDDPSLKTSAQRIDHMFLTALGRHATSSETARIDQYFEDANERIVDHRNQVGSLRSQLAAKRNELAQIIDPVRQRLLEEANGENDAQEVDLKPISHWDFSKGTEDLVGDLDGRLERGARLENGRLVVDGKGYLVTSPLKKAVRAKTLEAWVQLANLNQRGGGVITIQTPNGVVFDSIVFAERDQAQWMSGSNSFSRTQGFGAYQEKDAANQPVHIAIVYQADGQIIGYRNGKPYGKGYKSNGPLEYKANESIVTFGVRHLQPGGNRMLSGQILKASLYDRALSPQEVAISFGDQSAYVSDEQVLNELTPKQRDQVASLKRKIKKQENAVSALGKPPAAGERELWTELARAIFTFKEFIYIR